MTFPRSASPNTQTAILNLARSTDPIWRALASAVVVQWQMPDAVLQGNSESLAGNLVGVESLVTPAVGGRYTAFPFNIELLTLGSIRNSNERKTYA